MRVSKPDVIVALDFGGSLTKVVYQTKGEVPTILTMNPEVVDAPVAAVEAVMGQSMGLAAPETSAWVRVGTSEMRSVVGALARQFHASTGLRGLKWERAIPKTLAVLWVIQQRLGLRSGFKVAISCLLPPGEYEDRHHFESYLTEALAEFSTPTGTLRVKLERFECRPECGGVALGVAQQQSLPETCAFFMLGYRNASVLIAQNGRFGAGRTSDLGFARCVEQVQLSTSGLSVEHLVEAMAEARQTGNAVPYMRIMAYTNPDVQQREARRLVEVVDVAKVTYAQMLYAWFSEVLPLADRPSLLFYGGTTDEMMPYLAKYQPTLSHAYHVGVSSELDLAGLGHRLADVYAVFLALQESVFGVATRQDKSKQPSPVALTTGGSNG